ncbi:MAG: SEL1-like repeat protein [Planctomycetes bacterium]|nr:SEL1-like repeat protein [Planctomycetota bacterium]
MASPIHPQTIGRYQILGVLGQGGMGTVYEVSHPSLNYRAALKVLHAGRDATSQQRERFRREIHALSQVSHEGVLGVLDLGEHAGMPWFLMPLVRGDSLESRLSQTGRLPVLSVLDFAIDLVGALQAAHAAGVVHRDLKPANILLNHLGRPILTDFGLAFETDSGESRLTRSGAIFGSPGFASPEQIQGRKEVSGLPSTDVWGFGAVLFAALVGESPFGGSNLAEVFVATCERPCVSPRSIRAEVPAALDSLVLDCLAKEPEKRPSISEILERLHEARLGPFRAPRSRLAVVVLSLAFLAGTGVAGGAFTWIESQATPLAREGSPSPQPKVSSDVGERRKGSGERRLALERRAVSGDDEALLILARECLSEGSEPDWAAGLNWLLLGTGRSGLAHPLLLETASRSDCPDSEFKRVDDWLESQDPARFARFSLDLAERLLAKPDHPLGEARALSPLLRAARSGNPDAMSRLAKFYEEARPPLRDQEQATYWWRESAKKSPQGMWGWGRTLILGRCVEPDAVLGRAWLKKAAEAGSLAGQIDFAIVLEGGVGGPPSPVAARRWLESAARGGSLNAKVRLAVEIRDEDPARAKRLVEEVTEKAEAESTYLIANATQEGAFPGGPQVAEAYYLAAVKLGSLKALHALGVMAEATDSQTAIGWYERAAARGFAPSLSNLAINLLERGHVERARRCLEEAVALELPEAHNLLAKRLLKEGKPKRAQRLFVRAVRLGNGYAAWVLAKRAKGPERKRWLDAAVKRNHPQALTQVAVAILKSRDKAAVPRAEDLLQRAAALGDLLASFNLAQIYIQGLVEPDTVQTTLTLLKQAEPEYVEAAFQLAQAYRGGLGVDRDLALSTRWLKRAADRGYPDAIAELGVAYATGAGVGKDPARAEKLYEEAARLGQVSAMFFLGRRLAKRGETAKGVKWLERAAAKGNRDARRLLETLQPR